MVFVGDSKTKSHVRGEEKGGEAPSVEGSAKGGPEGASPQKPGLDTHRMNGPVQRRK